MDEEWVRRLVACAGQAQSEIDRAARAVAVVAGEMRWEGAAGRAARVELAHLVGSALRGREPVERIEMAARAWRLRREPGADFGNAW